ncbi:MAG: zinc-finger domain-containing protein [Silanimonas sp.]|nr:MAG: zinc-finger domain-containing protein [Silanimonas sp.]
MLPTDATAQKPANTERVYQVKRADLPLSCPTPEMRLWNSHPRVYLPIEAEGGISTCPYCGAKYELVD